MKEKVFVRTKAEKKEETRKVSSSKGPPSVPFPSFLLSSFFFHTTKMQESEREKEMKREGKKGVEGNEVERNQN